MHGASLNAFIMIKRLVSGTIYQSPIILLVNLFNEFEPRYLRQHGYTKHSSLYIKSNLEVARRHFLQYAERTLVTEIKESFIEDYFDWRVKRGKKLRRVPRFTTNEPS